MKKVYFLPAFMLAFFFTATIEAQIYVKHDAAGANDGSSWANAFTDLSDGLSSSTPGAQVWVAAGTYKPGGSTPSPNAFFTFPHDLELYGGFAGTETMLSERDWVSNETILSGDHDDDDIEDNFDDNRLDNSIHVMFLTDTVTNVSVIDGFTFRNGNTEPAAGSGDARRGGGLLTYGTPDIRNCRFTQNYGYFGGGLYTRGTAQVIVEDCVFENNAGGSQGGGYYNIANEGAIISGCAFTGNQAIGSRGGGYYNNGSPSTISNCTFSNNSAPLSSGGSLQIRNADTNPLVNVNISDCTFTTSSATWGGAVGVYDSQSVGNFTNCEFTNNNSLNTGGASTNAFGATTNFTNCTFTGNESGSGGAINSQNDSAYININNCTISLNAANTGGAINITGDNEPSSPTPIPMLTIQNTFITNNIAAEQGAGINLGNANAAIINTLFDTNINTDAVAGIGGAMSINTSDSIQAAINLMNCTVVNNSAFIGAGISHWTAGTESSSTLTVQNTILYNPLGINYEVEDGTPVLVSNGGNLSTDISMENELIATNDLNVADPLFVDFDNGDYHLQNESPCVDAGISAGAPLTDIEGLDRVDDVDMGAYENQKIVSVNNLVKTFGQLTISPNPIQDDLNFSFESSWNGQLEINITDQKGAIIFNGNLEKNSDQISRAYDLKKLPAGIYHLTISNGSQLNTESFVK